MMRRGVNFLSSTTTTTTRTKGSDDDGDEDYVFDEDDDHDSDVPKGFIVSSSDDDVDVDVDVDEEDHHHHHLEKKKMKMKMKKKKKRNPPLRSKSSKPPSLLQRTTRRRRRRSSSTVSDDDYEEDYDFDQPDSDHDHTRSSLTKKKKQQQQNRKRKRKSLQTNTHSKLLKNTNLLITTSHSDHDFDVDYMGSRNTPLQPSSHSDDPSDAEYTISDEDEELLREANHFIHNSTTHTRNSSLFTRRLHATGPSNYHPPKPNTKQQTQNVTADTSKQVCGICFSEQAKGIVRGSLNCCTHYFCFACIMEWSKIESRCPLCKQRFVAISKPARSYLGVDLRTMVIQVPKRDQVYQPSEEELRDFLDPYDGVVCMECQLGGDDCLMLLCDICDSPAHTYCVGLGREVPEGNWYCKGCRISEPGPSNAQVQDLSQGTSNSGKPTYLYGQRTNLEDTDPIPQSTVSVSESMNEIGVHLSPRHSVADDGHLASPSGLGVSTLSGRRRIHRQIRNLISSTRMSQRIEMVTQTEEGNVESEAVPNSEVEQVGKPNTQHEESSGFNSFAYDFWTRDGNPSVEKEISSPYI